MSIIKKALLRMLLFAAFGLTFSSYGATITARDGNWNDNNTWSLDGGSTWGTRQPQSGDIVEIPNGVTVTIPYDYDNDLSGSEATVLKIYGTLYFASFFGGAWNPIYFDLNDGDKVEVYDGGTVSSGTVFLSGFFFGLEVLPIIYDNPVEGPALLEDGDGPSPLPVDLISFKVVSSHNIIKITWSTATELNNDYFTIERSGDGVNFEPLTTIPGFGTTNEAQHYEFIDEDPLYGWSYYRLKQTDFDGTTEIFKPVTVEFSPEVAELSIYPNPVQEKFNAQITGDFDVDEAIIELYDLNGNLLLSETHSLQNDRVLDAEIFVNETLQTGHYIIHVNVGDQFYTSRIMKN